GGGGEGWGAGAAEASAATGAGVGIGHREGQHRRHGAKRKQRTNAQRKHGVLPDRPFGSTQILVSHGGIVRGAAWCRRPPPPAMIFGSREDFDRIFSRLPRPGRVPPWAGRARAAPRRDQSATAAPPTGAAQPSR